MHLARRQPFKPEGSTKRGRPKLWWLDTLLKDLKALKGPIHTKGPHTI